MISRRCRGQSAGPTQGWNSQQTSTSTYLDLRLKNLYPEIAIPPTAKTPPPIAAGSAQAGEVPMPTIAKAGPAHPPIAAPAVANGTVAAMPTPPVARPTLDPSTPPATAPTPAPTALIVPVAAEPAATTPTTEVAVPPAITAPSIVFSAVELDCLGIGTRTSTSLFIF